MSSTPCPDSERLKAFAYGTLAETEAADLARHLDECRSCEETLTQLEAQLDTLVAAARQFRVGPEKIADRAEPAYQDEPALAEAIRRLCETSHDSSARACDRREAFPERIGQYRLLEELPGGAMGRVFRAEHERLHKVVALKLLPQWRLYDPTAIARFEQEVQAVGRLAHPNIVSATDAGEHNGLHYLVMEFVDGCDLTRVAKQCAPLAVADACELIRQTALALQYLHEQRLVHRDIKPANLMLGRDGTVRILDFGLARLVAAGRRAKSPAEDLEETAEAGELRGMRPGADGHANPLCRGGEWRLLDESLTATGQVVGTPNYMAPEQRLGQPVDIRADIFSLGLTLCRLLYPGSEGGTSALRSDGRVSPDLVRVLSRMMAESPSGRFSTPAEVAQALTPFSAGSDLPALAVRASGMPADAGTSLGKTRVPVPQTSGGPAGSSTPRWIAAAISVLLLLTAGLFWEPIVLWVANRGELRIEVLAAGVTAKVEIQREQQVIEVIDLSSQDKITLHAGDYGLRLRDPSAELSLESGQVTIRRGGRAVVKISRSIPGATAERRLAGEAWGRSPLDNLDSQAIPAGLRFAGQPRELVAAMATSRGWHPARTLRVAISPDGAQLASCAFDAKVRIWDSQTLLCRQELIGCGPPDGEQGSVLQTSFSPDGRQLVSCGGDGAVRRWQFRDGSFHLAETLRGHSEVVMAAVFAPDGRRLFSASHDKTVRVWNLAKPAAPAQILTDDSDLVLSLAISANGGILASGAQDGQLRLWDVSGERAVLLQTIKAHQGMLNALTFLANDTSLVTVGGWPHDKDVRIWRLVDRQAREEFTLRGHTSYVASLAVHPRKPWIATGSKDRSIRLWDLEARRELCVMELPLSAEEVDGLAFSPDGAKLFSTGDGQTIHAWDLRIEPTVALHEVLEFDSENPVWRVAFTPDARSLVAGAHDSSIRWWDLSTAKPRERSSDKGPSSHVRAVAVSPDGHTLVAGGAWDTNLYRWRGTESLERPAKLGDHGDGITCLAFSHDGRWLASGSYDKTVRMWQAGDASWRSQVLLEHPNWVQGVAFSPDGIRFATACRDGSVRVWRREGSSWTGPTVLPLNRAVLCSVTFTPDGRHLVGGTEDGRVVIWAVPMDGATTPRVSRQHTAEICLSTPPGMQEFGAQFLSAGLDGIVHLWDARTGRPQRSWSFPGGLQSACFAPDGRHVALGRANGTIYVLRLNPAATAGARPGASSDERRVVSASLDKTIRLWDVETGQELGCQTGHHELVWCVAFSPDDRFILSGGGGIAKEGSWLPGTDWLLRLWMLP